MPNTAGPVLLWFRRDLRLDDHPALTAAIESAREHGGGVIPLYVLDDESPGAWRLGGATRWWLHHSLAALDRSLAALGSRLILRRGAAGDVLARLCGETGARTICCSRVFEPWAGALETRLHTELGAQGVQIRRFPGTLLFDPDAVRTKTGEIYKVYTPFWRAVSAVGPRRPIAPPTAVPAPARWPESLGLDALALRPGKPDWAAGFAEHWQPGEAGAIARIDRFLAAGIEGYDEARNRPDRPSTSGLSPHLAHGEVSPARVWSRATAFASPSVDLETFQKELVWREFSAYLLHHFPHLPERAFKPAFDRFAWVEDAGALRAWQRGQTGIPIVDAGMRQLWTTGWMHNRVRMIVASFLVKNLLIPWQAGEAWFWDCLVDADLASNAASWQWVAGSGADAAPYFRIFNPVTQGQTFDPAGDYVRRYVPELARLPAKLIHAPWTAKPMELAAAGISLGRQYPRPIADLAQSRERALAAFAALKD